MPQGGGWELAVLLPKGWLGRPLWPLFCKGCWAPVAEGTDGELAVGGGQNGGPPGGISHRFGVTFSHLRLQDLTSLPCGTAEWQGSPKRERQLPRLLPLFLLPLLHFKGMLLAFLFFCKREKHPFAFLFFFFFVLMHRN